MKNLLNGLDRAENNPFFYGAFDLSSENTAESLLGDWSTPVAPFATEGTMPTPPIDSRNSEVSDVTALRHELDYVKGQLSAVQSILRDLTYGTDARLSFFEQTYRREQIKTSRVRQAQEQQLERRLQHHIEKTVVGAIQQAMEKFIRVRRSMGLEPPAPNSTYKVPNRPEGKGIFR